MLLLKNHLVLCLLQRHRLIINTSIQPSVIRQMKKITLSFPQPSQATFKPISQSLSPSPIVPQMKGTYLTNTHQNQLHRLKTTHNNYSYNRKEGKSMDRYRQFVSAMRVLVEKCKDNRCSENQSQGNKVCKAKKYESVPHHSKYSSLHTFQSQNQSCHQRDAIKQQDKECYLNLIQLHKIKHNKNNKQTIVRKTNETPVNSSRGKIASRKKPCIGFKSEKEEQINVDNKFYFTSKKQSVTRPIHSMYSHLMDSRTKSGEEHTHAEGFQYVKFRLKTQSDLPKQIKNGFKKTSLTASISNPYLSTKPPYINTFAYSTQYRSSPFSIESAQNLANHKNFKKYKIVKFKKNKTHHNQQTTANDKGDFCGFWDTGDNRDQGADFFQWNQML